jgi:hypothetical protein
MNRFSITLAVATVSALAFMAAAPVGAHAEFALNTPGQWLDIKHHVALGSLPDGNEYAARAEYAKIVCHAGTGTASGEQPTRGYDACMRTQGFVFVPDSPAQIAARKKTIERAQPPVVVIAPAPPAIDSSRTAATASLAVVAVSA